MGGTTSRNDFEWSYTAEPHATRRKEILGELNFPVSSNISKRFNARIAHFVLENIYFVHGRDGIKQAISQCVVIFFTM